MITWSKVQSANIDHIFSGAQADVTNASDKFFLFKLNDDSLNMVLGRMGKLELISFSYTSKKAKKLVKSIDLKSTKFTLEFSSTTSVTILFGISGLKLCYISDKHSVLNTGYFVPIKEFNLHLKADHGKDRSFKDCVLHLMDVLDLSKIDVLQIGYESVEPNPDDVCRIIEGFKVDCLFIDDMCGPDIATYFLTRLGPSVKHLRSWKNFSDNSETFYEIILGNFDTTTFSRSLQMSLDDILSMNCRSAIVTAGGNSDVLINRFMKNWIRGGSRRIEYIIIIGDAGPDRAVVMKGVEYQVANHNRPRVFRHTVRPTNVPIENVVTGGYDIRRRDGIIATVRVLCSYVEIFVWN